jgi:hypothetical protein
MRWILAAFILGSICAILSGCAKERLTIVVKHVQSDVDIQAEYELEW